jgi:hypothetical protein
MQDTLDGDSPVLGSLLQQKKTKGVGGIPGRLEGCIKDEFFMI